MINKHTSPFFILCHEFSRTAPSRISMVFLISRSSSSPYSFYLLSGHIRNQIRSSSPVHSMRSVLNLAVPSSPVASCNKWAASMRLMKIQTGFEGVIQIPWEQKIKYKFVVDGKWLLLEDQPTEVDPGGYVNNTYTAPAKPAVLSALDTTSLRGQQEKSIVVEANNHRTSGDSAEKSGHASAESFTGATNGKIIDTKLKTSDKSGFPLDLASAIAARDGTSSALAVDPINIPQVCLDDIRYSFLH